MTERRIDAIAGARLVGPGAELLPGAELYDVLLRGGVIADIAPAGALRLSGDVLDADGAVLIPGLWDHHVHVTPWALASMREPLGDAASAAEAARIMSQVAPGADGRRVGIGFRDAFWSDAPALRLLDEATGDVPTYLVNADVHSVWLNSAALRHEGLSAPDGVLREETAFEVSRRLNDLPPHIVDAAVVRMARAAAARGLVGLVDLDMVWNEEPWQRRIAGGFDGLRVEFGIYPHDLDRAIASGLRTGERLRDAGPDLVTVGSLKVITDGSLGTRTAACSVPYASAPHPRGLMTVPADELRELMTRATAAGLSSAIHAIGDDAVRAVLDSFTYTGATGTIEHAQLVAAADMPRMARLGVAASVQPEHALDDRDLTDTIWAAQTATAYPLRSLHDAGVELRFGSDAPVSPLDPWRAIAAAVHRGGDGRAPWRPEEAVGIGTAITASTHRGSHRPDALAVGERADLALVAADPTRADDAALRAMEVRATVLGGRVTHLA